MDSHFYPPSRSTPTQRRRLTRTPAARGSSLTREARARGLCGTSSSPTSTGCRPDQPGVLAPGRRSTAQPAHAPEALNCSAPDTGTWSAASTSAHPSSRGAGSPRCSRRDPLVLRDDDADVAVERPPKPRHPDPPRSTSASSRSSGGAPHRDPAQCRDSVMASQDQADRTAAQAGSSSRSTPPGVDGRARPDTFGYRTAPDTKGRLRRVRVPSSNLSAVGRGLAIAQARLDRPDLTLHRAVGIAERSSTRHDRTRAFSHGVRRPLA